MSVSEGAVNGSYVDGLLSCSYHVNTTNFPPVGMRLFYGIGEFSFCEELIDWLLSLLTYNHAKHHKLRYLLRQVHHFR